MNMPTMQNPNDVYSYYPTNLYQPFSTFDDHNQWGSTDTSGALPPGSMPYHPQMYTPSPLDIPRSPFDYPPPPHHAYPHYHHGFPPSSFAAPPPSGTSAFDMPWNPHNLPMQQMPVAPQQQMTPIGGGLASNKKPSAYDEYPSGGVGDMLAQHIGSVHIGGSHTNDDAHNYDNEANDSSQHVNSLASQDQQQHYQTTNNHHSLSSRPFKAQPSSNGPKSYASVVSADTINPNSNKSTPSVSNVPARSFVQSSFAAAAAPNERNNAPSSYSNDPSSSRSNTNPRGNNYSENARNGASGYNNARNQQQSSSSSSGGGLLNWTNTNSPSNSRGNHSSSTTYYNSNSSNYYDRSSYSQEQPSAGTSTSNRRQNANYQQNYPPSRTNNNVSNGGGSEAGGQQPLTPANHQLLDTLKRNHDYNPKDLNTNPKGARFFVIKSVSARDREANHDPCVLAHV